MKDILPELNGKDYIEELHETYDIHFCGLDEVEELVKFIHDYWRQDHIFTYSRELLDFQHKDVYHKRYNFVLATNRKTGEIHSILGFVPTFQYDAEIKNVEVWPCIWKSRDDIHVKGLGVSLYHYMKENIQIETISILGISEVALSIYKHWNFKTGKIEHFFFPNYDKNNFGILGGNTGFVRPKLKSGMSLNEMSRSEFENLNENGVLKFINRYKSKKYYINRFFEHPIYQYKFFSISENTDIKLILVARICEANGACCIRIVDCIGNIIYLTEASNAIQEYLNRNDLEYMDFVEVGLNETDFVEAGFKNRKKENVVVPNYFEPYLGENVDLDYAYKTVSLQEEIIFFKADADQDRPNLLK